jgi:hypothetical protein
MGQPGGIELPNKRLHLTVGRPAVADVGFRSHPPAGEAQRSTDKEERRAVEVGAR